MRQLLSRAENPAARGGPRPVGRVSVAVAADKKERELIFRLRYRIYVEEMGRRLKAADHKRRLLRDDLDDWGLLFYARAGREVVGTVRLHVGARDAFPPELAQPLAMDRFGEFYPAGGPPPPLSFLSKVMVDSQFRGSKILNILIVALCEECRRQGILMNFLGCAPHLVALYEHLGFRRYKSNFFVPEYGYMVPFVNLLEDIDHLRRVGSPLASAAARWPNSPASAAWFARKFPDAARRYINKSLTGETELWRILGEKLGRAPDKAVELFGGLDEAAARLCAHAGHMVYCEQGDTVVYPDDMSNEIFIVITGALAVRKQLASPRQTAAVLGPGQAYGEKAFLAKSRHNATVVALADTDLLVLPRYAVERLEARHPAVAARLLRNLGKRAAKKYA